ncbi:MAG: dihydrodipicolinate synthase family protein [Candidatus Aminicenantes bacterium]|nr:dihydrodipicolinate synthase family protein [Candidatus Aminicenantes bacterium]
MVSPLFGIFPALTTPFAGDAVALDRFRDNIHRYNGYDLSGYIVLGSTGECVFLTDEESERLVRTARESAAAGKKVVAGTARESTKLTIDFTNRLAGLGIDAALVRPPAYYKARMDREALRRHYLTLADHSRVPVIIYNIPQNTGIVLEPSLLVDLAAHPNIAGLKDSSGHLAMIADVQFRVKSDFSYLLGAGSVFVPALALGASGAILAVADAAPGLCAEAYTQFLEKKLDQAFEIQKALIPLNRAVTEIYGIPGLKYGLDLLGFYGGPCRVPLGELPDKGKADLRAILEKLGLLR